ncbi:MAG: poly-gamma-glutamate system protein [bacterium]|nr:poly-gamma-glutamate system protein [bacterium]
MRRHPPAVLAAMLGLALATGGASLATAPAPDPSGTTTHEAARLMAEGTAVIRRARLARGLAVDPRTDPNRTGLIGVEWTATTTTLGSLTSKRTGTNPNLAAGLVRWLHEAGVREGGAVAVGASGSFPGLALGTLAAVRALGGRPITITSVGASSWGANEPGFTWLDMEAELVRAGLATRSVGASPGGEDDDGAGLQEPARGQLLAAVERSGVPLLSGETLSDRVAARMAAYAAASGGPIAAFVNIGGAAANMGTCLGVLNLRPGVHRTLPPCRGEPGVMWRMSARGVPVLHLLHVEGIAAAFGLPVDPVPLPEPGQGAPFQRPSRGRSGALLLVLLGGLLVLVHRGRAGGPPSNRAIA